MSEPTSSRTNVVALHRDGPDPERLATIKRWFVDQAIACDPHVCVLNIAITADGRLVSRGLGIEPEHAAAMLAEIDAVRERLADFADKSPKPGEHSAKVVPLRH